MTKGSKIISWIIVGLTGAIIVNISYFFMTIPITDMTMLSENGKPFVQPINDFFLFNFRGTKEDINVFQKENSGLSFVMAGESGKEMKLVKFFISKGADVNTLSPLGGLRPLHTEAFNGKADMVELLLANGAEPTLGSASTNISYPDYIQICLQR